MNEVYTTNFVNGNVIDVTARHEEAWVTVYDINKGISLRPIHLLNLAFDWIETAKERGWKLKDVMGYEVDLDAQLKEWFDALER